MTVLQEELEHSKNKSIFKCEYSEEHGITIVQLCKENVETALAILYQNKSYSYSNTSSGEATSSAYWFKEMNRQPEHSAEYRKAVENTVNFVDKENGIHLNADGVGRKQIAQRIIDYGKNNLFADLKLGSYKPYYVLAERTTGVKRGRQNKSFASKFCHFACFHLFENKPEQDNYCIYDSIVKGALQYYLAGGEHYDLDDYAQYSEAIDSILVKNGNCISRHGFDQLIWYYYK